MRADLLKLGVVGAVAVLMTAVLAVTLGNITFTGTTTYSAVFTDASGLRDRDDVRVNGVNVGSVSSVQAVDGLALVRFEVEQERRLTTATRAAVKYKNVIGQRYLELATPREPAPRLRAGGRLPESQTEGALDLTVLFNGFRPLFDALEPEQINTLSTTLVQTLQGETGNLASLVEQLSSLTGTLADKDAVIGRVIENLDAVATTVADRDGDLRRLLDDLRSLSASASEDRDALFDALSGVDALATTTGTLLERGRPALREDLVPLNDVLGTLVDNQAAIDEAVQGLPGALAALNRATDSGAWLSVYGCNLRFDITAGTFERPGAPIFGGTREQPEVCR